MSVTTTVTVSVMFTDLVGSTELAARLGPAAAEELRAAHFGSLRVALAATGGTEVKNLGDGLMVVYPSLTAALDGAVAMQQTIEQHNRKAAVPLQVRLGVSHGDATEDDGDYFGEPVVEAARLCAKAVGGQILTTEMVHLLARRSQHRFRTLGPVELKGLPDPVNTCALLWEPAVAAAMMPLPTRLEVAPATGVIGRRLEGEQLLAIQKDAFAGNGHRIALLSGEPGIGKTTLAGELAQRGPRGRGSGALRALRRRPRGSLPAVRGGARWLDRQRPGRQRSRARRAAPHRARHVSCPRFGSGLPTSCRRPAATDTDDRTLSCSSARWSATAHRAGERTAPVVLVLDDLHWADKPTVLLLRHLAASLHRAAVLLVGTYRDTDLTLVAPADRWAGRAAQGTGSRTDRRLAGLDDDGVVALLEAIAGHEMDDGGIELAHAVRRETDGNPFFTAEVAPAPRRERRHPPGGRTVGGSRRAGLGRAPRERPRGGRPAGQSAG